MLFSKVPTCISFQNFRYLGTLVLSHTNYLLHTIQGDCVAAFKPQARPGSLTSIK